ncbi:L-serine ammonia-lyase, iron-sulfur-dependent, subunit alpha [Myxococcota bacterium]|nr:L-serine ammonia-lyase, iron-sulfur-dependent, subunit alpha [Myxococcota bacterium]
MNILKDVLKHEVFPALGCTEPIAVAWAAALAGQQLDADPERMDVIVDQGVYKNGFAVAVPNSGGKKGNAIAAALGALIRRPELEMKILQEVTPEIVTRANELVSEKAVVIQPDRSRSQLYIDVTVHANGHRARAVLEGSHRNVVLLQIDNQVLQSSPGGSAPVTLPYREQLKTMNLMDFVALAQQIDEEDEAFLREGIFMNLKIAKVGETCQKVGFYLADLRERGFLLDDVFSSSRILTASAADARMGGVALPVMSSGQSGNQGIVAILVPYNVGKYFRVDEKKVLQSIALSHLVNSYVKCYTGSLSPLCGCAIASGVGAAVAIVFQQVGADRERMKLAVNNLISDLGGMLCDGAKSGCALKVASSTDSAILAAYMAIHHHGINESEGFVGRSAEETIWNLSTIGRTGMAMADDTMLRIMEDKLRS